jgi:cupin 2 domain-containing protein
MNTKTENLLRNLPKASGREIFESIFKTKHIRCERIISKGHKSPPGFWYDQKENEWVLVLKGKAKLEFQKSRKVLTLAAGDYVNIPARAKHRVKWTDPKRTTVWLAVFY